MQYANPSTQKLYRRLRSEGASASKAKETIQLLLDEKPLPPESNSAHWEWESPHDKKAELPYYHGNRRF